MLPKKPAGPLLGYGEQKLGPHPSAATSQGNIFSGVADLVIQQSTSENNLPRSISVTLGAHNFKKHKKTQQIIPVKTAIIHPDYHPKVNDIMLLQLQRKAKLTATASPLSLPRMGEEVKPGMECSVALGGRLDLNTTINTLHKIDLKIPRDCASKRAICVGDPKENRSSFLGDSGGPFVCDNLAQSIVSFGGKKKKKQWETSAYLH
ncbi:granzyme H-like [Glossophaga mutica]